MHPRWVTLWSEEGKVTVAHSSFNLFGSWLSLIHCILSVGALIFGFFTDVVNSTFCALLSYNSFLVWNDIIDNIGTERETQSCIRVTWWTRNLWTPYRHTLDLIESAKKNENYGEKESRMRVAGAGSREPGQTDYRFSRSFYNLIPIISFDILHFWLINLSIYLSIL